MPFRSIQSFPNRLLSFYCAQVERQKQVLQRIRGVLPPQLARHALHCVVADRQVKLYTDAAAWASQLRFHQTAILAAVAAANGASADNLQIRIVTEKAGVDMKSDPMATAPSIENIAIIRKQSDHIADDELRRALQKLCATLSKR